MNQYKAKLFSNCQQLQQNRITISPYELDQFWQTLPLIQMQKIFSINNPAILQVVTSYLQYITPQRKIAQKDAYYVIKSGDVQVIVYDGKIFKNYSNQALDNQFVSSLLLAYKNSHEIQSEIHQFIDTSIFQDKDCVLKCKESCILRLYSLLKQFNLQAQNTDIIVVPQKYYIDLVSMWVPNHWDFGLQFNIICLFKAILVLMQNQLYREFYNSLSNEEKYNRQYQRPVKTIKKPKNKQQFTMPQKKFGEVTWQELKIKVFKLKYKIVEQQDEYLCFREKQRSEYLANSFDTEIKLQDLSQQDQNIFICFETVRMNQPQFFQY